MNPYQSVPPPNYNQGVNWAQMLQPFMQQQQGQPQQQQPQQPSTGFAPPNWMRMFQPLFGNQSAQTGTSPQPPNPYNQQPPFAASGLY